MNIRYFLSTIAILIFIAFLYDNLMAFKDGIVGLTKKDGQNIGCVCHQLEPNDSVSVRISGPAIVRPNDTANFVLSIAKGPAIAGGCDIAVSRGNLIVSPIDTFLQRIEQFPGSGYELTHKTPKLFSGDTVKFYFRYIAPSIANITDTIFANGNSTNNDESSDGDLWNYANNFVVSINSTLVSDPGSVIASNFMLLQNFPNPFNPSTRIEFATSKPGAVTLKVFDTNGKQIAVLMDNPNLSAGTHSVDFRASDYSLNSGVYFYELNVSGSSAVKKMILIK